MDEKRELKEDVCHVLQGPHHELSVGFVSLRLRSEIDDAVIDVNQPAALLGRHSDADLRFAFEDVSRRHCRFAFENGQWRVYDLRSLNGVFRNGEAVIEATLYAGDRLRMGSVRLLVESATPVRVLKAAAV
jgi:pSer/pThr/pTyr-binding forkhead associated (FHA) protein